MTVFSKTFCKIAALMMALCLVASCLVACGGKEIKLTVNDMGEKIEITSKTGTTVAQALKDADITLGEKDETDPASDTKLTEDIKEILVKRYAKVTVVYGDQKKEVEMVGGTVADAIKEADLTKDKNVTSDVPETDYLKDGMTIKLTKGVKVSLTVDGETKEYTAAEGTTVKDFLAAQKIKLGENDEVSEKLDAPVTDGMKLVVKRVEYKEETKKEEVDYKTEEQYSDSMATGESKVSQEGVKGEKEVTYKVKYVDGKEDSREKVKETVTKEPVNKIVVYGSKTASDNNSGGSNDSDNSGGVGDSGSDDSGSGGDSAGSERTVVSKQAVPNCDDGSHGYYVITYSDGSVEYEEY